MDTLAQFVKDALTHGIARGEISNALIKAGWPQDEVADSLSRFADVEFPIPVPSRRESGSAREAFLHLVTFFALYVWTIALGSLLFGLIQHVVPDPAMDRGYGDTRLEGLRWSVASLAVAFPIYYGLVRQHLREYALNPERRTSAVRRWLTYFTLFVAAVIVIVTMITTIGEVLGGELAIRFVAQAGTVLAIAGAVFAFYLRDMRDNAPGGSR